jgi:hypothetical protein
MKVKKDNSRQVSDLKGVKKDKATDSAAGTKTDAALSAKVSKRREKISNEQCLVFENKGIT